MKKNKRLMIWGSNLFLGLTFDNSQSGYVYLASSCIMQLHNKYSITNFSMNRLSSHKALYYLNKALAYDSNYDAAIIELGFEDLIQICKKEMDIFVFEDNIKNIIDILKASNIKPYLTTMSPIDPDKFKMRYSLEVTSKEISLNLKRINRIIKNLAAEEEVELLDDNRALSKNKDEYVSSDGISINLAGQNLLKNMINRKNL